MTHRPPSSSIVTIVTQLTNPWDFDSAAPDIAWPAIPPAHVATMLSICFQLEQSQWLPAEALRARQLRQLDVIVRHAGRHVPHYREQWRHDVSRPLTWDAFTALPLLTRQALQSEFTRLRSEAYPAQHGNITEMRSSGSTGMPVRILKNDMENIFWQAILLRDHAWHRRDLGAKLAVIRQGAADARGDNWGGIMRTGPLVTLPVGTDVADQLAWLAREQPGYLLSHPTNIAALARLSIERGVRLPSLLEVRTSGEICTPPMRALCSDAWNVPVSDMYSSNETGYIALQCPAHEHYHVQAEGVMVEVLDAAGRACAPGEIGRVVATTFHNLAMPLIRYDIGDYAEAGPPCACGRGLPVLTRILGRSRNMLMLPGGGKRWPFSGYRAYNDIAPVRQFQLIQNSLTEIEARLVVDGALSATQRVGLIEAIRRGLGHPFAITIREVAEIPRSAGGKFEEFISLVS
jgi:phenylacetate-CoA ligase